MDPFNFKCTKRVDMRTESKLLPLGFIVVMLLVLSAGKGIAQHALLPELNISALDFKHIQYKTEQFDWAKAYWVQIRSIADEAVNDSSAIELPLRGGNWGHYYVDPEEGKPMKPGKYLGNWHWEHHNQDGTKTYYGVDSIVSKDYDGVLILTQVHAAWATRFCALSFAYRMTGNTQYLKRAVQILEAYAKVYTRIPFHNKAGGNDFMYETGVGRVSSQALDESVWLIKILQGASLIWTDLSAEQHTNIEKNFLFPAVDMIQHCFNLGIHNISNWYNAAVGMTGYLTSNPALVDWALHEKNRGLQYQLQKGFTADGHWYENAPAYHFYALKPMILLAESAKNNGDTSFLAGLKKALDAPLELMMPDMNLPRINDSREVYLPAFKGYYEYGYSRFKNQDYLPVLTHGRNFNGGTETVKKIGNDFDVFDFSLLYREPLPATAPAFIFRNRHLNNSGLDILYQGEGKTAVWLLAKYDINHPSKGWHTHPDALNFVLYGSGSQISIDPGTAEYGAASHVGWDKTSVAHNSLVINQQNQSFKGSESLSFGKTKGVSYSFTQTDSAYKGVSHTRGYILADNSTVLIADWITAPASDTIDIAYHQRGNWKIKETGRQWQVPDIKGYQFLKEASITVSDTSHLFSTAIAQKEIVTGINATQPVQLIEAMGIGPDFEPVPCVIARCRGAKLFVLWSIRLDGSSDKIRFEILDQNSKPKIKVYCHGKVLLLDPAGKCAIE